MTRHLVTLTLVMLVLPACGGTGAGFDIDQGITARMAATAPAEEDGLSIDTLVVQVIEVVFDAEGPDDDISITAEQRIAVDLSDGVFDGLTPIELTPGTYEDPYLGIEVWDETDEPGIVLEGTLDGQAIRFEFNSGEVFEAESDSVTVPEGEVLDVVHTLEPGAWFRGIDGTTLAVDGSGVAVISETSNENVFDRAADALDRTTDGRFPGGASDDD